ncbi:hypothetical protein N028_23540 [Pseudomonas syringae USA011]|nr:hypothetical protein N028_23540 [Pseudomonas syringae USA011]
MFCLRGLQPRAARSPRKSGAGRESPRPAGRPGVGIALQRWRDWISRLRHPSRRTALQEDAERPERHAHAEHGHDSALKDA